ncbi:hypothetical protein, partial [Escherichia coli]|uniref:hypothetical protein n=1 Tax=Escherichia coli TaxID=562 RepID=UPI0021576769
LDRLVQQGGFDGRTQRYHYDLTGKLTQSEDEGLITLWHYDASDRITHRTVNGDPELHPDSTLTVWPDNRIAEDAHYV